MKKIIYSLSIIAILASCDNSDDGPSVPKGPYEDGIIILNEGNFGKDNASVSMMVNGVVENNVFSTINSKNLGDTAQSITLEDDYAYIVVNGSNTVEVVNRYTFEHIATINSDIKNPRHLVVVDDKAYITNWGDATDQNDDFITVVNLNDYTTSTISVPYGPEDILEEDGNLFIAHQGGWQFNNIVTVIDEDNHNAVKTITVGDVPSALVAEDDYVYVLSSGMPAWSGTETAGSIHKIDGNKLQVTASYNFNVNQHPGFIKEDDNKLYITLGNDVLELTDAGSNLGLNNLFSISNAGVTTLYGFGVKDGKFYLSDAKDYVASGEIFVLDAQANVLEQHTVGYLPNGFYFND